MTGEEQAVGAVIDEMYAMISGPAGPRDWARRDRIFDAASRQVRTWIGEDGRPQRKIMSPAEYAADTGPFFERHGFFEVETARRINIFGNIAHVWSIYEARPSPDAPLERRGINSIQLFFDGEQWRIISMIWDNERPGVTASL